MQILAKTGKNLELNLPCNIQERKVSNIRIRLFPQVDYERTEALPKRPKIRYSNLQRECNRMNRSATIENS